MAKSLDAPYEAGNRGAGWLKIKRAHTLDLVVHRGRMGPRPAHAASYRTCISARSIPRPAST